MNIRSNDSNTPVEWHGVVKACHWATVLLVAALYGTGYLITGPQAADVHASLGATLILILLLRIAARAATAAPHGSRSHSAAVVQAVLYLALASMVVTGPSAVMRSAFTPAGQVFGIWAMPAVLPVSTATGAALHSFVAWATVAVITLHVAAVFWRNGTGDREPLRRMLPSLPKR